jgi:hypothetical protein
LGRLNDNSFGLFFDDHLLFGGGLEIAFGICFCPKLLYGVHNLLLLGKKGIAQVSGPVKFLVHHIQHLREIDQRLDTGIPGLRLQGFG